jgi:hypothetical protein
MVLTIVVFLVFVLILALISRGRRLGDTLFALTIGVFAIMIGHFWWLSLHEGSMLPFRTFAELDAAQKRYEGSWYPPYLAMATGPKANRATALAKADGWTDKAYTASLYSDRYAEYATAIFDAAGLSKVFPKGPASVLDMARYLRGQPRTEQERVRKEQTSGEKFRSIYSQDLNWPLWPTAAIDSLRQTPFEKGLGGLPIPGVAPGTTLGLRPLVSRYLEQLRATPLGLDPKLEEDLLWPTYFYAALPNPDLRAPLPDFEPMKPCDGMGVISRGVRLSDATRSSLNRQLNGKWCEVVVLGGEPPAQMPKGAKLIRLDMASYRAPQPNPLTGPALDRIAWDWFGDRGKLEAKLAQWGKAREQRARENGSEANWVWNTMLSKNYLLFIGGKVIVMPETEAQILDAANDWVRRSQQRDQRGDL